MWWYLFIFVKFFAIFFFNFNLNMYVKSILINCDILFPICYVQLFGRVIGFRCLFHLSWLGEGLGQSGQPAALDAIIAVTSSRRSFNFQRSNCTDAFVRIHITHVSSSVLIITCNGAAKQHDPPSLSLHHSNTDTHTRTALPALRLLAYSCRVRIIRASG